MDVIATNSIETLLKLNTTLRKYGISLSVFMTIAYVEKENKSLSDIGEAINIASAGMTSIRDTAEKGGWIVEIDTENRRKKIYGITDKGKELLASCRQ